MSARAYDRILKVSRTIADLEGSDDIRCRTKRKRSVVVLPTGPTGRDVTKLLMRLGKKINFQVGLRQRRVQSSASQPSRDTHRPRASKPIGFGSEDKGIARLKLGGRVTFVANKK